MPEETPLAPEPGRQIPLIPTLPEVTSEDGKKRPADLTEIVEEDGVKKLQLHFHPGQYRAWQSEARFVAIIAGAQSGKDLALDTPILTPTGFKTMGEIHVGDQVYGTNCEPCHITGESEVFLDHKCWELTLDCGEKIVAGEEHLWTFFEVGLGTVTRTTDYLATMVRAGIKARIANIKGKIKDKPESIPDEISNWGEWRYIVWAEKHPTVPTKCIAVDSPDRLYLCGKSCIPTHNTVFGPVWLWREIMNRGPGDYLVVTPTYTLLEVRALPAFRRFFETQLQLGTYFASPVRRFEFSPEGEEKLFGTYDPMNRTKVLFAYAEDPESLESMTAKAAWLDEAGQKKFRLGSWQAINRRLAINRGRALMTTTPYDFGWLKGQVFDRYESGDKAYDVINFQSTENPAFPKEEFERAKNSMPEWQFDLFYRGKFRRPDGLIYDCFEGADIAVGGMTCERFNIPLMWDRYVGLDFGGVNMFAVLLAEEPFTNQLFLYRRYRASGRIAVEHCRGIQQGEPEFKMVVGGSKGEGQWRAEFRAGGVIDGIEVPGLLVRKPRVADVKLGISRVYGAIKRREVIIFNDLEDVLDDIESYSWEIDANQEPTGDIDDKGSHHAADSLRYIIGTIRGPNFEAEQPLPAEAKKLRDRVELIDDKAARTRLAESILEERDNRERARQDEADRLDREAQKDPFNPRWW